MASVCAPIGESPLERIGKITERKRAEESRARFASVLEATSDLVGFADPRDGRVLYDGSAQNTPSAPGYLTGPRVYKS